MGDRLSYVDVEHLVAGLSDSRLEDLVEGPLPDGDDAGSPWNCRVCMALRGPAQSPPATALLDWHEFEAETGALEEVTGAWRDRPTEEDRHLVRRAHGELSALAGMLSHARCLVIYSLARIELAARRL